MSENNEEMAGDVMVNSHETAEMPVDIPVDIPVELPAETPAEVPAEVPADIAPKMGSKWVSIFSIALTFDPDHEMWPEVFVKR